MTTNMKKDEETKDSKCSANIDDDDATPRLHFLLSLARSTGSSSASENLSKWNSALEKLGIETVRDLKVLLKYTSTTSSCCSSNDDDDSDFSVLGDVPELKRLCREKLGV